MFKNNKKTNKKIGLRKAADNHCRSCIYDEAEPGTWRQQVELCTATDCDLYQLRPHPIKRLNSVNSKKS